MFDQFYYQSSDELKLAFLREAFQKYPHLQEDFLNFYLSTPERQLQMTIDDPVDFIIASTDLMVEALESIDFNEPDWEHYAPRHSGYIPEYEAREHMAEDEIGSLIGFHVSEVERYCAKKHFDQAFLYLISIYQACVQVVPNDEYDTLPDPTGTMLNHLEYHLQDTISMFKSIIVSNDQLFTIASVLFDHHLQHYPGESQFLRFFESHLFLIIQSGGAASVVLDLIEKKKVSDHIPWLVTELHRLTDGAQGWEQAALRSFKKDKHVASALLDFYKKENKQAFIDIARELWYDELFREEFASLYYEVLEPDDSHDLYREVTLLLNSREFTTEYYQVLQSLMDKEERLAYIKKFKRNAPAYARALCMEGNYAEALEFAEKEINRWNIADVIAPCAAAQPKAAIKVLERKISVLLEEERGRNFYARIAEALKIAAQESSNRQMVENLAVRLHTTYSRLAALRDELRKAELIRRER